NIDSIRRDLNSVGFNPTFECNLANCFIHDDKLISICHRYRLGQFCERRSFHEVTFLFAVLIHEFPKPANLIKYLQPQFPRGDKRGEGYEKRRPNMDNPNASFSK